MRKILNVMVCAVMVATILPVVATTGVADDWVEIWGGPFKDTADDVAADQSGGIYLSGTSASSSSSSSQDFLLLKYDATGTLLWSRKFDYGLNQRDEGCRLDIDQYGDVYIAGRSVTEWGLRAALVKSDPDGTLLWHKTFDYPLGTSAVYSVVVDKINNWVYATGWGHEGPVTNAIILKYDYNGNLLSYADWSRATNLREYFKEAVLDDSGNIYVAGFYEETVGQFDYHYALVKYDSNLNFQWEKLRGGDGLDYYNGITRDQDGYIYTSGFSSSGAYYPGQMIIHKYDANGNFIWERAWGGSLLEDTWGITVGEDRYLYVAGYTETETTDTKYDAVLLKYDLDGNLQPGTIIWGGTEDDKGRGIFVTSYNTYFCGYTKSYGSGEEDVFLMVMEQQIPEKFILVGTDKGRILLYEIDPGLGMPPFAYRGYFEEAVPANAVVQGLDIFDYDNDNDLDFIALVRTWLTDDWWAFNVILFRNDVSAFTPVWVGPLPAVNGVWYAALADATSADFDNDFDIDFIVHIPDTTDPSVPTVIYRFENTGTDPPFVRLQTHLMDVEDWAEHAKGMDSADFFGTGPTGWTGFATFDYPHGADFHDDVVGRLGDLSGFPLTGWITHSTPHSINTITAGQFNNDNLPDVIVGGDDDGDPGQYWLYQNNGDWLWGSPVEVFDLSAYESGSDMPGDGFADAYDFDGNGMMDVVATADLIPCSPWTTLFFVPRIGPASFQTPQPFDVINSSFYGGVTAIAAPMTTRFGVG